VKVKETVSDEARELREDQWEVHSIDKMHHTEKSD